MNIPGANLRASNLRVYGIRSDRRQGNPLVGSVQWKRGTSARTGTKGTIVEVSSFKPGSRCSTCAGVNSTKKLRRRETMMRLQLMLVVCLAAGLASSVPMSKYLVAASCFLSIERLPTNYVCSHGRCSESSVAVLGPCHEGTVCSLCRRGASAAEAQGQGPLGRDALPRGRRGAQC